MNQSEMLYGIVGSNFIFRLFLYTINPYFKIIKPHIIMNESNKITWTKILRAVIQAAIAALTALGVTSCTTILF